MSKELFEKALKDQKPLSEIVKLFPRKSWWWQTLVLDIEKMKQEEWLHLAAKYNRADVIEELLDAGINVNARSAEDNSTPLHEAAGWGAVEAVKILLARKADVHAQDRYGATPLHEAAYSDCHYEGSYQQGIPILDWEVKHREVARLLLDGGASVNAEAWYDDKFPAKLSENNKPFEAGVIDSAGSGATPLHHASSEMNVSLVELLLQRKANVHAVDKFGNTPLHMALHVPYGSRLKDLKQSDEEARGILGNVSGSGYVPRGYIRGVCGEEIIARLLRGKASISAKNKDGMTPDMLLQGILEYPHSSEETQVIARKVAQLFEEQRPRFTPSHVAFSKQKDSSCLLADVKESAEAFQLEGSNEVPQSKKSGAPVFHRSKL